MGPQCFWWGNGMWVLPILFLIVALIGVTIFLFIFSRGFCRPWANSSDKGYRDEMRESESPLDILKKRYAKGEITKAEFDQMKKDLLT